MSDDSIEYFVYHDNEVQGPLTKTQIKRLLRKGGITGETLCAVDGGSQWAPVSALFAATTPTDEEDSLIDEGVAWGSASSVFFGFIGILCLGGVVLQQEEGFWFVAMAALVALISGIYAILRGRSRETGPMDSKLALGGIAAGCIALMAGTWLPLALNASEPLAEKDPKDPAEITSETPEKPILTDQEPSIPDTLAPPNTGVIDTGPPPPVTPPPVEGTGVIDARQFAPINPVAPPKPLVPGGNGGVQPFPAPPAPPATP